MAKTRYNLEVQEAICNALATHGLDEAGWKAGGIHKNTFYEWQRKYPEFGDAVSFAKAEYRKSHQDSLQRLAKKALVDYLSGTMTKVSHLKKEALSPTGEIVQLEEWRTTPVGVPQWAIDRVLAKPMHEIEILDAAAEKGFVPRWVVTYAVSLYNEVTTKIGEAIQGNMPESEIQKWIEAQELSSETKSDGISDETWKDIRARVMGVNADSHAALSKQIHHEPVASADNS